MKRPYSCHHSFWLFGYLLLLMQACTSVPTETGPPLPAPVLLAGEPTAGSIVLQARLSEASFAPSGSPDGLLSRQFPGLKGIGYFELSAQPDFQNFFRTPLLQADSATDFILKARVESLQPGTAYYYRLAFGEKGIRQRTKSQRFTTLPDPETADTVRFVMVTGSHLERFYMGGSFGTNPADTAQGKPAYQQPDAPLGFPALEAISRLAPHFYIGNGDNVYYDHPPKAQAKTKAEMRARWHRLFQMPRMRQLMAHTPAFWLKDDHDYRFDDGDTLATNPHYGTNPTHEEGKAIFLEQIPLTAFDEKKPTYRNVRVGKLLELWFLEGRDFRSPNAMPDGPEKTMWGQEQLAWLQSSLLESRANFKLIITPTPFIGPDDARKKDNHTNPEGFRYEGQAFLKWLNENGFGQKNLFFLSGDRHWQYHSIDPSGFEEFSSGALVSQNARLGRNPGDPASTDPEGLIRQPFSSPVASGGFLEVQVLPESAENPPQLIISFRNEQGAVLHRVKKGS